MSSSNSSGYAGYMEPSDRRSDYSASLFLINSIVGRIATCALVRVLAVSNADGALAPVGFVDVAPLVNQLDGVGNPVPHTTLHNLPYFRLQGGASAVILDPSVNDIGVAMFCSRDISTVKRTKSAANPESRRRHDWSDGVYIGGMLNGVPTQYVRSYSGGIEVVSPTKIKMTAPDIELNGNVVSTGTLNNNGHNVGSTHLHTASGGTGLGGPPQ